MLVIDDNGEGSLTICPSGSDLINGTNNCKTMTGQDGIAYIDLLNNKWRLAMAQTQTGSSASTGLVRLSVRDALFPASNFAVLNLSQSRPKLLFDDTTSECAAFPLTLPADYHGSAVLYFVFSAASGVGGTAAFDVSLWATNPGASANTQVDDYDTANTCTATAPGTAGYRSSLTCPLTQADSAAVKGLLNLRVCRNVASDSVTGDLEILNEMLFTYAK